MRFLRRIYAWLLALYPRKYRDEYGGELRTVFDLLLGDAMEAGGLETARVALRELSSLPGAALPPVLVFGALPTLLGYFRLAEFVPLWAEILFVILLWLFGLSLLAMGFVKGFPRWFMPYIGVPMSFISLLLFSVVMEKWQGVWWYRLPGLLSELMQQGLLWMGLIFSLILVLAGTRLIPKSRPLYRRLKEDGTLISFIVYGSTPFALWLTFDDYSHEEPFMFFALLILAAGGWLYLRSDQPWKRFSSLQGGLWFSMLVAAAGKALLVESSFPGEFNAWQTEFMSTIFMCLWLAMIMLIPLAFRRRSRSAQPLQTV